VDRLGGSRLDLHLFAAGTRSGVAVARSQFAGRRSIRGRLDCCRSRSDSEVESTLEALRLAVLRRCAADYCFQRSKVERQCTVRVRGQQA